jgi:hypothetical protein
MSRSETGIASNLAMQERQLTLVSQAEQRDAARHRGGVKRPSRDRRAR